MTTDPIKIEFAINSSQLNEEFKRIVSGSKTSDEAIDALRERFKQLNAEQLLGVKGMEEVAKSMTNISQESAKWKLGDLVVSKETIDVQKSMIKELETELKNLKKTIDKTAPGQVQNEHRKTYNQLSSELVGEKQALQEMTAVLGQNEEAHKSLASQVRTLLEDMRQLELQGKKNTDEYEKLKDEAAYLEEIRKRTRASLRGENDDMRALSAGVNLLAGSYSTAMGVVGMFTDDTAKMERIQTKLQSAIALTVGIQQVSEGLAKEGIVIGKIQAIQATALAKAKNLEATNTGKATIAQRIYNAVAKANPYVLLISTVLSLGVAYVALRLAIGGASEEQRKLNKEIGKEAANAVAEPLLKYKTLQRQWKALNGDLKEQNEFLEKNKDKFAELGVQVDNVNDAENLLVNSSGAFIEAMMLRARAAAMATQAQNKFQESIELQDTRQQQADDLSGANGWWHQFTAKMSTGAQNTWNQITGKDGISFIDFLDVEQEGEEWLTKALKLQEEASKLLEENGVKSTDDLANNRLKTDKKTSEQIVSERKKLWEDYYAFEATFGKASAKKQFASLREESKSYFEWLEKEKSKYTDQASEGNLNTQDLEYLTAITKALADLQGQKSSLQDFTEDLERSLRHAPDLVSQLDIIDSKIKELSADKANIDSGVMSFVVAKKEDIERELEEQALLFVQAHLSLADKKLAIDKKYLELSKQIATLGLSDADYQHQLNELEKAKNEELKALEDAERKKVEIVKRYSESLLGISKRQLLVRIASLEEYLNLTKNALNDEQREHLKAELTKAKALASTKGLSIEINALLQERKQLLDKIKEDADKGIVNEEDVKHLEELNQQLGNRTSKTFSEIAEYAGQIAGGFYNLSDALQEINPSLSETLDTLGDISNVIADAAGAAASFAAGDIIGGTVGAMNMLSGVLSIGAKSRASRRQAEAEMKKWQDEIYQAGLDYNRILREQLISELEINASYQSRLDTIKKLMDASRRNLESVKRDMNSVMQRLLESETIINKYTKKTGGFLGIGKKTKVVEEFESVANLLKDLNKGVNVDLSDVQGILDMLAEINSKAPLTGDAKAAYEQLLALKDEYGDLNKLQAEYEKQIKDTITGTTTDSIKNSIIEGLASGKKSFADFADDIEGFIRQGILAGMSAKIIEPEMQKLQDSLAEFLGDGVFDEDEKLQFQEMYMRIVSEAKEYMDLMNQTGIDFSKDLSGANSLQGAYKAASQESIDLLAGNTAALRLSVMDGNMIARNGFAQLLEGNSRMLAYQKDIERNTRATASNTEKTYQSVDKLGSSFDKQRRALEAAGII